jgi:hypothetical protein
MSHGRFPSVSWKLSGRYWFFLGGVQINLTEGYCGRCLPGCGRASKNWVSQNSSRAVSMHCRTYRRGYWIMTILSGLQEQSCVLEEAVVRVHRRGPDKWSLSALIPDIGFLWKRIPLSRIVAFGQGLLPRWVEVPRTGGNQACIRPMRVLAYQRYRDCGAFPLRIRFRTVTRMRLSRGTCIRVISEIPVGSRQQLPTRGQLYRINQREAEMDRDITPSLHLRLEEFRLEATVAYYAPRTMGNISNGFHGPLSEAEIVECIAYLHGSYTDSIAELGKQQQANVELRRRLTSAEERAERASAHAALMKDAYAVVGREYRKMRGGKRPRPE